MDAIFLTVVSIGLLYSLISAAVLAVERYRFKKRRSAVSDPRPVSILKPLKGTDDALESNLRSFFELDYPSFELIFGVNDADDPAIEIVRKLQRAYPSVRSSLVIDEYRVGLNPKIANLHNMYREASFEYLVISDSNARVRPDYLTDLISHFELPDVGLVSSLIRGEGERTIGSFLENTHMNSFIAASVMAVRRIFGVPIVIGKSMLIRRTTLQLMGGFEAFANYLAEDHLIGLSVQRLGLRAETTFHAVESINMHWSVSAFLSRHLRWATMRRHLSLPRYFAELLSNPVFMALIFLLVRLDMRALAVFGAVCVAKTSLDMVCMMLIGARARARHVPAIPVKEIMMGVVWILPLFIRRVSWRGNKLAISGFTRLSPVAQTAPWYVTAAKYALSTPVSLLLKSDVTVLGNRVTAIARASGRSTIRGAKLLTERVRLTFSTH